MAAPGGVIFRDERLDIGDQHRFGQWDRLEARKAPVQSPHQRSKDHRRDREKGSAVKGENGNIMSAIREPGPAPSAAYSVPR